MNSTIYCCYTSQTKSTLKTSRTLHKGNAMSLSAWEATFTAFISTFLVYSFASNVCVLVVIVKNKTMRTVTNIFLSNLAVSDMILASLVLPQQVHDISHTEEYFEGKSYIGRLGVSYLVSLSARHPAQYH